MCSPWARVHRTLRGPAGLEATQGNREGRKLGLLLDRLRAQEPGPGPLPIVTTAEDILTELGVSPLSLGLSHSR